MNAATPSIRLVFLPLLAFAGIAEADAGACLQRQGDCRKGSVEGIADVNNGIARRSWARNAEARWAIEKAMETEPGLRVTLPNAVDDDLLEEVASLQ
jgi:hypothetical protein